jgi:hypothetical protein
METGMPAEERQTPSRTGLIPTITVGLVLFALAGAFMFFAH